MFPQKCLVRLSVGSPLLEANLIGFANVEIATVKRYSRAVEESVQAIVQLATFDRGTVYQVPLDQVSSVGDNWVKDEEHQHKDIYWIKSKNSSSIFAVTTRGEHLRIVFYGNEATLQVLRASSWVTIEMIDIGASNFQLTTERTELVIKQLKDLAETLF